MSTPAIALLTFKSRQHILSVGGTCSWALNRQHAKKYGFAVCTRNANTRVPEGPEDHATAFVVGRISDVVQSPENPERWLIQFSEYAEVAVAGAWGKGWRNPVRYTTLEELGINEGDLAFQPMPEPTMEFVEVVSQVNEVEDGGQPLKLTIAEAKEGLSAMFGVPVEAIEVTIRA